MVLDLEPLWIGRIDDILTGKERLRDADLTNRKTHEADHNATPAHTILGSFRTLRMQLVQQLDALDPQAGGGSALHPRLEKPMRLLDLMYFIAEHDDHHLAQMTRLQRRFGL
ncbi:MAG: DinB family protein [Rhodothermales bacterium]